MTLAAFVLGLFLGTVAGILLWPFLWYRQSGAEPGEPAATGVFTPTFSGVTWIYDGEAVGV